MIENLNGIHETVKYKENSNVKLFINVEVEDYPFTGILPWRLSCRLKAAIQCRLGMIWYILMRVILSL